MPKRRWTAEQKMQIVLAGLLPEANIAVQAREHQISQSQFYRMSGMLSLRVVRPLYKTALPTGNRN